MRIISGRLKGRRLLSFNADHIRPTTDRVKESLFNKIAAEVESSRVLDLFAGTGNLGIESLSRGANFVTFVESNRKSLHIIKDNLKSLGIEDGFEILPMDVFRFLKKSVGDPYDLIFVDPPFTEKLADTVLLALASSPHLKDGSLVAIESGTKEPIGDTYEPLYLVDRRPFGDKTLSIFTCRK